MLLGASGDWSQIAVGAFHSMGVTARGELCTWGRNVVTSLGHGNNPTHVKKPKQVMSMMGKTVAGMSGWTHTAVVTTEGELFTW